ncbi:MAG: hypothetical protein IRY90_00760, partial [Actinomadura rubrobrunea]|nr:hypothetical protein [Actinomadura rubrobrunea]
MNTTVLTAARDAVEMVLGETTRTSLRPRFEGSNICTWIGFKHVNYLVEEAVLGHLRHGGLAPGALFEEYGLGVDLVDIDTRILTAFHIDDVAIAEVVPTSTPDDRELAFAVTLHIEERPPVKAVNARVKAVLRHDPASGDARPVPEPLRRFTVPRIDRT